MRKFADSNGIKISYQLRGEGDPLVLIMGFGADGNVWEQHTLAYEQHFKCIILDNRGVGESDQPIGPYSTQMMADDVIAVMDKEGVDKARIAGISMGGAITQAIAINYPERVQSIALISTWPKFNNYAKSMYENLKKIRMASDPATFMELLQLWIFASPYYETEMETLKEGQRSAAENDTPQTQAGFEGQLDACIGHDATDSLAKITVPTLITVGDMDVMTPPSFSEILHRGIKGSQYVVFSNAGHVHHWEDLDRFNTLTTDFFLNN
jgi:pimeloyl-ACP methyl ester carboxylesterase